jgi:hypothetical protein
VKVAVRFVLSLVINPYVCNVRVDSTSSKMQPEDSYILLREPRRQIPYSVCGQCVARSDPSFTFPFLRRPSRLSIQYQSHTLQRGIVLGRTFVGSIRMRHVDANLLA